MCKYRNARGVRPRSLNPANTSASWPNTFTYTIHDAERFISRTHLCQLEFPPTKHSVLTAVETHHLSVDSYPSIGI